MEFYPELYDMYPYKRCLGCEALTLGGPTYETVCIECGLDSKDES